jgi:AcrR family transcriptional regulator
MTLSRRGPSARRIDAASAPAPRRSGRPALRDRTRQQLMDHAMQQMRLGRLPSVAEVAQAAGVSRATAYRYFASRSTLITAVVGEALGPVRRFEPATRDGTERIRELFDQTFPRLTEFEPHLRAALLLALEHQWRERAGVLEEEPFRRGHRIQILRRAAAPLRRQLGSRAFDRLLKALSLVYGIESYVVLKDIWGCQDAEVQSVSRWMTDALVARALAEARGCDATPATGRAMAALGDRGRTGPPPRR